MLELCKVVKINFLVVVPTTIVATKCAVIVLLKFQKW